MSQSSNSQNIGRMASTIAAVKAEPFTLIDEARRSNLIVRLLELPCDGSVKVIISDSGGKRQRQRGLEWLLYGDIAVSGVGNADTKERVHLVCKYKYALPVLLRDDEFMRELWGAFISSSPEPEKIEWFIEHVVHTEKFTTGQMAEYMDEIIRVYSSHGVNLTDPKMYGL